MSGTVWSRSWPCGSATVTLLVRQPGAGHRQASVEWSCGAPPALVGEQVSHYLAGLATAKRDMERAFGYALPISGGL